MAAIDFYHNTANSQQTSPYSLTIGGWSVGLPGPTPACKPTFVLLLVLLAPCWLLLANSVKPLNREFSVHLLTVGSFLAVINIWSCYEI